MDQELFASYWQPMLEAARFGGTFAVKRGPLDGLATFWSEKFRSVVLCCAVGVAIEKLEDGPADVKQCRARSVLMRCSRQGRDVMLNHATFQCVFVL